MMIIRIILPLFLLALLLARPGAVAPDPIVETVTAYVYLEPEPAKIETLPPAPRVEMARVSRGAKHREMVVKATAYTLQDPGMPSHGITYSGLPADLGVVAVDPAVIPLGIVVWVPGAGYNIALDTGGAIKGNRIDVYFRDRDKALAWGRKEVRVRVYSGDMDKP